MDGHLFGGVLSLNEFSSLVSFDIFPAAVLMQTTTMRENTSNLPLAIMVSCQFTEMTPNICHRDGNSPSFLYILPPPLHETMTLYVHALNDDISSQAKNVKKIPYIKLVNVPSYQFPLLHHQTHNHIAF